MFIGNMSKTALSNTGDKNVYNDFVSGVWIFNHSFKVQYSKIYDKLKIEKGIQGNPILIMYLNKFYTNQLYAVIGKLLSDREKKIPLVQFSEIMSWFSLGLTGISYGSTALASIYGISMLTGIGEVVGVASASLSVLSMFLAAMSKTLLKKLFEDIPNYYQESIKIVLYDIYNRESSDYFINRYEILKFDEYMEFGKTKIYGAKYSMGDFLLFRGYSTEMGDSGYEAVMDNIHKTFEKIRENTDNAVK